MRKRWMGWIVAAGIAALGFATAPAIAQVAGARIATPLAAPASVATQVHWRPRYRYLRPRYRYWAPRYRYRGPRLYYPRVYYPRVYAPRRYVYGYPRYRRVYRAYDSATAYCLRRFRSYDPYSRTYLGYDGYRHPCP